MKATEHRRDYTRGSLDESSADPDPVHQFADWFSDASQAVPDDPNAMTLATVSAEGQPSARILLLRGFDQQGFVFFTNYESRKGDDLANNPLATLLFFWPPLERQVRIEGRVEKTAAGESDAYFMSRPPGNRLGAWASPQSRVIESRTHLEQRVADFQARFGDRIPRPEHWGGYRLVPTSFEFWQGRADRLHDRIHYRRDGEQWAIERLAP